MRSADVIILISEVLVVGLETEERHDRCVPPKDGCVDATG